MDIDDIIYISKYSPMIIANLSSEEIIFLCDKAEVISIDVYSDNDFVSSNIETCSYAQLDTMEEELNSLGYTGSGISIGIIDSGIPLVSELDSDCLIGEMYGEYDGTHSSYVTNIMLSIAPDATYYFAGKPEESVTELIEWLIQQNVDIINMSLVVSSTLNTYTNYSKWFDHIASQHAILFISGAGNNMDNSDTSSRGIHAESMAYNNIAVGAMKYENLEYTLCSFSSYYQGTTYVSKPDVCALGADGTSVAAPRVAALAALLMEANDNLLYAPSVVKAIIMAAVDTDTPHHYVPTMRSTSGTNYMQCGAGLINNTNALTVAENSQFEYEVLSANSSNKTYTFNISSNDIGSLVRVSLAFLVPASALSSDHSADNVYSFDSIDLDLLVYAPNSTSACAISATSFNSVEIVEFTAQVAGTYTIEVVTNNNEVPTEMGIAWFID